MLAFIHSNPTAGHSRFHKTVQHTKANVYWKGMRKDLNKFVRECEVCEVNKHETTSPAGLLQPLPIPSLIWFDIYMDFIEGLSQSHGGTVILVVVDRFSKYVHFLPLSDPYTASTVAQVFLPHVFKLHGCPKQLYPTVIPSSPTLSSMNYFSSRAFHWLLVRHTIPNRMAKPRPSTSF